MAHYAKIENDLIVRVIRSSYKFIQTQEGEWKRTSYNMRGGVHLRGLNPVRRNFASAGYSYSRSLDAFIPPKPFASWVIQEDTGLWKAPVAYPSDGKRYIWNEKDTSWQLMQK